MGIRTTLNPLGGVTKKPASTYKINVYIPNPGTIQLKDSYNSTPYNYNLDIEQFYNNFTINVDYISNYKVQNTQQVSGYRKFTIPDEFESGNIRFQINVADKNIFMIGNNSTSDVWSVDEEAILKYNNNDIYSVSVLYGAMHPSQGYTDYELLASLSNSFTVSIQDSDLDIYLEYIRQ